MQIFQPQINLLRRLDGQQNNHMITLRFESMKFLAHKLFIKEKKFIIRYYQNL